MGFLLYLDAILVPLSFFLTLGYHGFVWHTSNNKPQLTAIGINKIRRRAWVRNITENTDDKKMMFAIQSLRNTLMVTTLASTLMIILSISLAAYTNNAYKANNILKDSYFGLQSNKMLVLKYGAGSVFLFIGYLCSSMAMGYLSEANILAAVSSLPPGYVQAMMERGFLFSFLGQRMLYITVPLLLWLFGPIPMLLSSIAIVWVLHGMDFGTSGFHQGLLPSNTARTVTIE
ncbi:hypothetical protein ACHQM5_013455 [Ranunculus cassubicifolius]